jgi:hypothetical protein
MIAVKANPSIESTNPIMKIPKAVCGTELWKARSIDEIGNIQVFFDPSNFGQDFGQLAD